MKDFRESLENKEITPFRRMLKRICIGNYEVSIQASTTHYSIPSKTLENLFDYEAMEVAIIQNNQFVNIGEDAFFNEWKEREKFLEDYDGEVAGFIPIRMIQSLCDYIEEKPND